MKTYEVTIPIAGHAYLTIEAESEEDAINAAMDEVTLDSVEEWQAVRQFNMGNVCYCPHPWEATAETTDEDDGETP